MSDRNAEDLLALIDAVAHGGEANVLVLADWLDEHGDPRAAAVRKKHRRYQVTKRVVRNRTDPERRLLMAWYMFQSRVLDMFPERAEHAQREAAAILEEA